jgi:hypothetical protein
MLMPSQNSYVEILTLIMIVDENETLMNEISAFIKTDMRFLSLSSAL